MSNELVLYNDALREDEAVLNITWAGQNGNLAEPVPFSATNAELKAWAMEAIRGGNVPGISADRSVDLSDSKVDRFPPNADRNYNYFVIRANTPYG